MVEGEEGAAKRLAHRFAALSGALALVGGVT